MGDHVQSGPATWPDFVPFCDPQSLHARPFDQPYPDSAWKDILSDDRAELEPLNYSQNLRESTIKVSQG
jgi:hypothetical protein